MFDSKETVINCVLAVVVALVVSFLLGLVSRRGDIEIIVPAFVDKDIHLVIKSRGEDETPKE